RRGGADHLELSRLQARHPPAATALDRPTERTPADDAGRVAARRRLAASPQVRRHLGTHPAPEERAVERDPAVVPHQQAALDERLDRLVHRRGAGQAVLVAHLRGVELVDAERYHAQYVLLLGREVAPEATQQGRLAAHDLVERRPGVVRLEPAARRQPAEVELAGDLDHVLRARARQPHELAPYPGRDAAPAGQPLLD